MLSVSQLASHLGVSSTPTTPSRHQTKLDDHMLGLIASPSRNTSSSKTPLVRWFWHALVLHGTFLCSLADHIHILIYCSSLNLCPLNPGVTNFQGHSFKISLTHPLPSIIYPPLHVIRLSCLSSERPDGLHVLSHARFWWDVKPCSINQFSLRYLSILFIISEVDSLQFGKPAFIFEVSFVLWEVSLLKGCCTQQTSWGLKLMSLQRF